MHSPSGRHHQWTHNRTRWCITYLSNLVAMEIHSRHTIISGNRGVSVSPVLVCLDSGIHQGLNLTHGVVSKGDRWTDGLDSASRHHLCTDQHTTQQLKISTAVIFLNEGAVKSTIKSINVTLNVSDGRSDGAGSDSGGGHVFVWTEVNIERMGSEVNPWWTVRQVSRMSPLTTTSDGTRDTV